MQCKLLLAAVFSGALALSRENFQYGGLEDGTINQELLDIKDMPFISDCDIDFIDCDLGLPKIFPVPISYRCIVAITAAYAVVFAALALTRTYHEVSATPRGNVEASLKAAFQTMTYGPMVCVLFLGYRMHVEFLSDGKDDPQWWAQICMYGVTLSMLASTLMVIMMTLVFGKRKYVREGELITSDFSLEDMESRGLKFVLSAVRYSIIFVLYGGLAGLVAGMFLYKPSQGMDKVPDPAPAIYCTIVIATIFFSAQIIIAACRTISEFTDRDTASIVGIMEGAASTVEFGPMLSVLFLAARMRALQHNSQPETWAAISMLVATGALAFTTLLAVAVPLAFGGTMEVDPVTNEARFEVPNKLDRILGLALVWLRYLTLVTFYGGTICVVVSIFTFQSPAGPEHTMPLSPTVQCVMMLTLQFFTIYFLQTLMISASDLSQGEYPMHNCSLFYALESARATVQFAPMLAILCVATRMYALLLTDKKGSPQSWVQYSMFLATWSLLISALACLGTGLTMGKVEQDEDGNVINKFDKKIFAVTMQVLRYCCMAMFYGGIIAIITGLFLMEPETATGRGHLLTADRAFKKVTRAVKGMWF
mmetsp:Transcript_132545/g.229342  ORF Transcript_132545/g.229342 Transcript_132545/m.229342 type:complete len:594 (-) Transcript_132545:49-1830(-)